MDPEVCNSQCDYLLIFIKAVTVCALNGNGFPTVDTQRTKGGLLVSTIDERAHLG